MEIDGTIDGDDNRRQTPIGGASSPFAKKANQLKFSYMKT